jgi:hypothetical protein
LLRRDGTEVIGGRERDDSEKREREAGEGMPGHEHIGSFRLVNASAGASSERDIRN